jgi:hypothetical protein
LDVGGVTRRRGEDSEQEHRQEPRWHASPLGRLTRAHLPLCMATQRRE